MADFNITCVSMSADSNQFLGKPLKELNLRVEFGINILGIKRKEMLMQNIQPDDVLLQGDRVYIQGKQSNIEQFYKLVK